ncbi:MAG: transcriptional regulator, AraC family [Paenibacillaceae bacterium]|jgi:AraC-like DNA-binding protein|nr:transcriptional regulator, AraC family [Paenibacillaceae bacterium]
MIQLTPMPWLDLFLFTHASRFLDHPVEFVHAHEGMEFLYVHEGMGQLILNGRQYRIEPRMLIFYQPFQIHSLNMDIPYTRTLIKIKLPLDERFSSLFPSMYDFISSLVKLKPDEQVFLLNEKQDAELVRQFSLFDETLSITPVSERRQHFFSFLAPFLSYLQTRIMAGSPPSGQPSHPRATGHIETVMNWLEQHYQEQFHLDKLSSEIHLSPSYLSRMFRSHTGTTITEYMNKIRLEEARLLLLTTSLPVSQISCKVGYADVAYFCRLFKQKYGIAPLHFRYANG